MDSKMNLLTILVSLLTIGLSTLLSYIVARNQKLMEFKFDYHRYMVERRKMAYEQIEKMIASLADENAFSDYFIGGDRGDRAVYLDQVSVIDNFSFWISDQMKMHITLARMVMEKMAKSISMKETLDATKIERFKTEIRFVRLMLLHHYFNDMMELSDIRGFRKQKEMEYFRDRYNYYSYGINYQEGTYTINTGGGDRS
jgi:hypothetical protein